MLRRDERTLEIYMKAGAKMRLYKTLGAKLFTDISKVLSRQDQEILLKAMGRIDRICSRAEDNMFHDHPQLSNQYIDVFYGSTDGEPRNEVDKEIVEMAKEAADGLFKGKGD